MDDKLLLVMMTTDVSLGEVLWLSPALSLLSSSSSSSALSLAAVQAYLHQGILY